MMKVRLFINELLVVAALCTFVQYVSGCTKDTATDATSDWERKGQQDDPSDDPSEDPEEIQDNHFFTMRGLCMGWSDVCDRNTIDYIKLAKDYGLNTFSVYNQDRSSQTWKNFAQECADNGIYIEHEEHMLSFLIPRSLFSTHPEYFRMNEQGVRVDDANGCPSCKEAVKLVAERARQIMDTYKPTNHKYYFWLDDGGGVCHCPDCENLNAADQALIFENAIVESLRKVDSEAMVAHLCYYNTKDAPKKVKPSEGIFLEFAPLGRKYPDPLANTWVKGSEGYTHADYLRFLSDNLKVFPKETAQVLEYWCDDSMFSGWDPNHLVEVPWSKEYFLSDLKTYASYGIRSVICYSAYIGPSYVKKFCKTGEYPVCLVDYAQGLDEYEN